jgi:hypothetical protein
LDSYATNGMLRPSAFYEVYGYALQSAATLGRYRSEFVWGRNRLGCLLLIAIALIPDVVWFLLQFIH